MGRFLLTVTVLLSLAGVGFALKCYVCKGNEDTCNKSKLQGDKDTYLKTCLSSSDRCGRSWMKPKDGDTLVTNDCSSQLACAIAEAACEKIKDNDAGDCGVGCCSDDECNAGSPVTFSFFLLIVCTVLSLALMK